MNNVAPVPPFSLETTTAKVRAGENLWNTRDPERTALVAREGVVFYSFAEGAATTTR